MKTVKCNNRINFSSNKGITLVALVITIIIIIIISTVAINFTFGEKGLIKRAEQAKDMYANDTAYTEGSILNVESYINSIYAEENSNSNSQNEPITVNGYTYSTKRKYDYLNSIFGNKKISILGDSISTLEGYIPENYFPYYTLDGENKIDSVDSTYWGNLIKRFNMTLGINGSYSGSMITNVIDEDIDAYGPNMAMASNYRIQILDDNGYPDIIIFYGGTNDYFESMTLGEFDSTSDYANNLDLTSYKWESVAEAYTTALLRLKYYYPNTKIITLLPHKTNTNWNGVMKDVCNYLEIEYVDLLGSGINNTHPNEEEFSIMTEFILNTLYENHIES